jgi:rhodanese-related sulfurtransferase
MEPMRSAISHEEGHVPTFWELFVVARSQIQEITPGEAADELGRAVFLDVREAEERAIGTIPGAVCISRGMLEISIESAVADRSTRVVVYCVAGVLSVLAARTLSELGYTDVVSMAGGFTCWRDEGHSIEAPTG